MSFAKLERPSATPSMAPSQAGPAPIAPRKAGKTAVAVSWLQSLNRLVRPTPRTVRLSQGCFSAASDIRGQFTQLSPRELRRARRSRRFALRARRRWIAIPRLSFSGAVQDDADFLQGDEATIHHFVQPGKELFNALGGLDDLENGEQLLRTAKDVAGGVDARATVARDAAKTGRTGETFLATVLRGVAGYGGSSVYHTDKILRLSQDLPIVLEVIESTER